MQFCLRLDKMHHIPLLTQFILLTGCLPKKKFTNASMQQF